MEGHFYVGVGQHAASTVSLRAVREDLAPHILKVAS